MTVSDARRDLIRDWLTHELHFSLVRLEPASADASFRRYFRVWHADGSTRVVMDAPPDKEAIGPFLQVASLLERCEVHVPQVHAADPGRGLVLLEDLGSVPYLASLRAGDDADALYGAALAALERIQVQGRELAQALPRYDHATLERELGVMPEWFCAHHLRLQLDGAEQQLLQHSFEFLIHEALSQPVVFVHRDFHSRNLMRLATRSPGVIDFQDALAGPVGYDLVSLLKDCYIEWPRARVEQWVGAYRARLRAHADLAGSSEQQFLRWFDLIGLQRHIKVLGIFARLYYRDGKPGYLKDLPRVLDYTREAAAAYPETAPFSEFIAAEIDARFAEAQQRVMS